MSFFVQQAGWLTTSALQTFDAVEEISLTESGRANGLIWHSGPGGDKWGVKLNVTFLYPETKFPALLGSLFSAQ